MTFSRAMAVASALVSWGVVAAPAAAQVTQPNSWTLATSATPNSTNINVNAGTIAPAAGANRVLVVAAVLESGSAGTVTNFNATLGGVGLAPLATTEGVSARETIKLWYLLQAQIPAGSPQLVVTGTHTQTVSGIHVYWAEYAGVFQAAPAVGSAANYNGATTVTFGVAVDYVAGGMAFYVTGNGGATATHTPLAGFAQQATSQATGQTSFALSTAAQASSGTFAAGTTVTFAGGTSARSTVAVAALRPIADLAITKSDSVDPILVGQSTTYTITVANSGPASATEAVVTDNLPAGMSYGAPVPSQGTCSGTSPMTCNLGAIANGASATITLVATAAAAGTVVNTASVTASQGDPNSADNTATQSTTILPAANLALTKTASPTSVWVGDSVAFSVAVTNAGPSNATNVTVTDTLPAGLTYVSALPSQGACSGTTTITCALGPLASGAGASIAIVVTGTGVGNQANTASVSAAEPDPVPGNNSATASVFVTNQTRNADVAVTKVGPASVALGANVTYTLTVTNNGPDSADDVRLSDPLPAGMTFVSATPSQGTCTGTALVSCTLGALASGGTATVTIVATNDSSGTKANVATVQNLNGTEYDPNPTNNIATATTTVTGGAAPLCVVPGKDGAGGTLSGVVNTYYPGSASVAAGVANTCISVGTPRGAASVIALNDLLLVIQMQDATINTTDTLAYGDGTGMAAGALTVNAGKYEFARARGAVGAAGCAANTVGIAGSGANGGLLNSYTSTAATTAKGQARFQVIRVPQYTTAALGGVTAAPWLTNVAAPIGLGTGGVLAIDVQGALSVNAGTAASVDGQGFRGAAGRQLAGQTGANAAFRSLSTINTHGGKGEGVAGTPEWIYVPTGSHACGGAIGAAPDFFINTAQPNDGYPQGSMARGAPANAGGGSTDGNGGANDQNSGGGGGSNGGAGGRGGYTWSTVLDWGGYGAAVTPALSQLVLGGGGGAGTRNNDNCGSNGATAAQEGQASSGASGGGLMVIRAGQVVAAGGATLSASGANAFSDTLNDGGGGGGAGGSVIVDVTSGTLAGLTIRARGGLGGSAWGLQAPGTVGELTASAANNRHGPGGGGGGGVIAYTNTAVPPTLDVSGGASGTTTTANSKFGSLDGGIGQTLFAAPGLVPGVGSGSACSLDLAIALTHREATVTPGLAVTFLATVSNAGPFITSSGLVTVTITLDPGFGPPTASGPGWTCGAPAGQSVTCTRSDTLAPQLSFAPITVTATVLASGPVTLSNNTATVANAGDVNSANDTATDAVGVRAPTLAHVRQFAALRTGDGVRLLWRTTYEVRNLGFRVYRESAGVRTLVTPSLIAGSALLSGQQAPSSGRSYSWLDETPAAPDAVYWLEDTDLDGTHRFTGPVSPVAAEEARRAALDTAELRSPVIGQLGRRAKRVAGRPGAGIGWERHERHDRFASLVQQRRIAASRAAVKLLVPREGWYGVSVDQLRAAGFDPGSDPRALQLFLDGREQALRVGDRGDGTLAGTDTVEFYGQGNDSPYDGERVYWLVRDGEPGARVRLLRPLPGLRPAPESFPFTVERRDHTVTFFALTTNGEAENFFGDPVTADELTLALELPHIDRTSPWDASLTIALQGVTLDATHEVSVRLNGVDAGSLSFSGQQRLEKTLSVPHQWLREGANEVTLVARGPGEDVSLVEFVRLTYAHRYELDNGALRFTAPAGSRVAVRGLGGRTLRVVDVSDPERPYELLPSFEDADGETTASVAVPLRSGPGQGTATLYAFLPANAAGPDAVVLNQPSQWHQPTNQADLLVVVHPSLRDSLQPLVDRRRAQGLATAVVDVTDVYDEYSYGQRTPYAIRSFLAEAAARWKRAPRYVLLAGDASFDPKNYLGFGDFDLVPTKLVPTAYMKTDSDDWLVDFDLDGLPDLSVGRLPARTPAEASLFVSKILARESALSGGPTLPAWARSVLLVSDEPDEFDFEAASAALRPSIPPGFSVGEVKVASAGGGSAAQVVSAIDAGQLLVNYAGHGSVEVWTKHALFGAGDVDRLANGSALPFVVAMTCLNGLFDDVFSESLAETFLKAPGGGAVAVWASSGLTEPEPQATLNQELFRRLFAGKGVRIGDAVRRAKGSVLDNDVRRTWILFGDPTMTLR